MSAPREMPGAAASRGKGEPVERTELRKRLETRVAEQLAHRTESTPPRRRAVPPVWTPPTEAAPGRTRGRVFLRFALFVVALAAAYVALQRSSYAAFRQAPLLAAVQAEVPPERILPGTPFTAGVRFTNDGQAQGSAFAVAVLASGEEIEGPTVPVPAGGSTLAPVELRLSAGDHVLALVAFDASDRATRLASFSGLRVWVGDREIRLGEARLPPVVGAADTVAVELAAMNPGTRPEHVVPVLLFWTDGVAGAEVDGPVAELGPGEEGILRVTLVGSRLPAGRHSVEVLARTVEGHRLAVGTRRAPLEVRP